MAYHEENNLNQWTIPYLPIDPHDVGRKYDADVIRINSQSGKGGIAYILEQSYGYAIPQKMREEVGYLVKGISDNAHKELTPEEIYEIFKKEYINVFEPVDITDATFKKVSTYKSEGGMLVDISVTIDGNEFEVSASGNGRLDAVSNALKKTPYAFDYTFVTYSEHALEADSNSRACAYVALTDSSGELYWGIGIHDDIILASINALVSAINRQKKIRPLTK